MVYKTQKSENVLHSVQYLFDVGTHYGCQCKKFLVISVFGYFEPIKTSAKDLDININAAFFTNVKTYLNISFVKVKKQHSHQQMWFVYNHVSIHWMLLIGLKPMP